MFLSGLKEKSIIRRLNSVSSHRQYEGKSGKISSIGLLQDQEHPFDANEHGNLLKMLGIPEAQLTILNYVAQPSKLQLIDEQLVVDKHLGWKGVLKPSHLKNFAEKTFDILISYYFEENLPLLLLSAQSAAVFKVGIGIDDYDIHDLTIQVEEGRESIFIDELEKYLTILKIKK